jgi:hypothetical protein
LASVPVSHFSKLRHSSGTCIELATRYVSAEFGDAVVAWSLATRTQQRPLRFGWILRRESTLGRPAPAVRRTKGSITVS